MSGAQQKRIQDALKSNPDVPVDQVIEEAKSKSKVIQVVVTLGQQIHTSLGQFARDEDTSVDEAASQLIQDGLAGLGLRYSWRHRVKGLLSNEIRLLILSVGTHKSTRPLSPV